MNKYLLMLPNNLGRILFGIWIIGMGAADGFNLRSPGLAVILGIVLVAAGVCTLFSRG